MIDRHSDFAEKILSWESTTFLYVDSSAHHIAFLLWFIIRIHQQGWTSHKRAFAHSKPKQTLNAIWTKCKLDKPRLLTTLAIAFNGVFLMQLGRLPALSASLLYAAIHLYVYIVTFFAFVWWCSIIKPPYNNCADMHRIHFASNELYSQLTVNYTPAGALCACIVYCKY